MANSSTFTQEIFNAREQVLTGDLMRLQALANRDLQNLFGDETRADQDGAFTTARPPVSSLINEPTWTPNTTPGNFTSMIGAGSGFIQYDPGGLSPDQTSYQVLRWTATLASFSTPDTTNGRIDTVYLTPAMLAVDSASRNILTDPVARTVGLQSVNKTNNPAAGVAVQTGTPAPVPLPPTIPAGTVALFDIYVPANAASASIFANPILRLNRRSPFPWSAMTGVMQGLQLNWDQQADPAVASASISVVNANHKLVIDGEVISFGGSFVNGQNIISDTAASPFTTPAPSTNAKVYYIYAVGGRSLPYSNWNATDSTFNPIVLVESTITPIPGTAIPNGTITTPRGSTTKACLVGIGYVAQNTTRRLACVMTGPMIYAAAGGSLDFTQLTGLADNLNHVFPAISSTSIPQGCQMAEISLRHQTSGITNQAVAIVGGSASAVSPTGTASSGTGMVVSPGSDTTTTSQNHFTRGRVYWPGNVGVPRWWMVGFSGWVGPGNAMFIEVKGYAHGVPRLDGMAGI